ncbi:MAG TPA: hypothetical protein VK149_00785 [Sideroxyarcus sp.]|nr:hypothetical protein [Sideroxyarcus sp.]
MQTRYRLNDPGTPPGPLRKLAALIVTVALIALVLMFSVLLFAIVLVVGAIAMAYLWWKTRELRKLMRTMRSFSTPEMRRAAQASNDGVFEGEVVRVVDPKDVS